MKELFDQTTQMMETSWKLWKQMISWSPWLQDPDASFSTKWNSWVTTVRYSYEVNLNTWKTLMEQSEASFFKMFRETPYYSESVEAQWRGLWDGIRKAQSAQQEIVIAHLEQMEELLQKRGLS